MKDGQPRNLARLPACQSCYTKKVKCDNARPKCSPCTKNGQACMTVSLSGNKTVAREYIYQLEEKIWSLQEDIREAQNAVQTSNHEPSAERHEDIADNTDEAETNDGAYSSPSLTEGAGLSFIRPLFADAGWKQQNPKLLQNLSKTSSIPEMAISPNPLPSLEEARAVFDSYLSSSHVQNPFLLRRDVQKLFDRVYPAHELPIPQTSSNITKHDRYRTFMILAVGSVPLYRNGKHNHHPYGYFLSAMGNIELNLLSRGLESIQDLLLIGRFGIYHHISTSIWEIVRLCMRMCVEQGLHKGQFGPGQSLLDEQLSRRVFWECYMIDRYSSITLDRPAAIADDEIHVDFPVDADDGEIEAAGASGVFPDLDSFANTKAQMGSNRTTETSVFLLCLRLRKITSKTHLKFQQLSKTQGSSSMTDSFMASGTIYAIVDELLCDLDAWRESAPQYQTPKCLYEMQEWYDLLLMRERLLLVRKAIDIVPRIRNIPPQDLLSICLQCAIGAILIFSSLYEQKKITYTRSYFQLLFTSGLSVMFCVSAITEHDEETVRQAAEAVRQGEKALKTMGKELSDAVHYVAVYEALRSFCLAKWKHLQDNPFSTGGRVSSSHETNAFVRDLHPGQAVRVDMSSLDSAHDQSFQDAPWLSTSNLAETQPNLAYHDASAEGRIWDCDIFGDSALWDMEAGLGEYAYGDPLVSSFMDEFISS
ncbi:hypothetical protein ASPWEDRAFT_126279 [Aspergillus wentii DTO 134E9]|uniref:Zn(2)-C6 fungal-type domain-containing protein n=1 Tax=Aspergillus wentii DTO 134E9 TaxID=1073089 RepID=A0A1L9S451_ASPWE|nr:uncharacterized protein ASPWEDRAFT_126279 [Aspergillus wentii DTO 134E9]OJJ41955.1 hypothetical protein ASPWEDRAFT_126279 [Aspergillus wentii DTO 134E9]